MDARHFDTVTRELASLPTRRRALSLLGGLGLAGLIGRSASEAKHKKRKRKKKHPVAPPASPPPGCVRDCAHKNCGNDGCGGSCGTCGGETSCRNGVCTCPDGKELCGDACYPPCPASSPGTTMVRHPGTCTCCVRPGTYTCPSDPGNMCCLGTGFLPCCAQPCNTLAVNGECREWDDANDNHGTICDYDIECYEGRRCGQSLYPHSCDPLPT